MTAVVPSSAELDARLAGGGFETLALDLRAKSVGDAWTEAVEGTSRALLESLGALLATGSPTPVVVVVQTDAEPTPLARAGLAAVAGVAGTAALEASAGGQRVNTVIVGDATSDADLAAVLAYLGDDEAAGFTTGATVDLRTAPRPASPGQAPVLITGAAGGLGLATARRLSAAGLPLILSDLPSPTLVRVADELGVAYLGCDVTSPADVAALAADPLVAQGISGLIVHHGVGGSGGLAAMPERVRDLSLSVNGTGVHNVVDALLPALHRAGRASIVVLASQAGLVAERGNAAYCAAKFAVVGYVQGLAEQLAASGISVHALCPGPVDTPLMRAAFTGMAESAGLTFDEYLRTRMKEVPLGRFGAPEHIGAATLLLNGLDATGVVLATTGGAVLT